MTKLSKILAPLSLMALSASQSYALFVSVDAKDDGFANAPFENENFWGINFLADFVGGVSIIDVTFDLRASGQNASGVFDIAGGSDPFGPIVGSETSGVAAGDVTFTPATGTGFSTLTVSFAPGAFTVGENFRFGADVDNMDIADDTAETLGQTEVGFSVLFSNGNTFSSNFANDGVTSDGVASSIPVPEPSAFALIGGILAFGFTAARRRAGLDRL